MQISQIHISTSSSSEEQNMQEWTHEEKNQIVFGPKGSEAMRELK